MSILDTFKEVTSLSSETYEAAPGLVVRIDELTVKQRMEYARTVKEDDTNAGVGYLVIQAVRDPADGSQVFPDGYCFDGMKPAIFEAMAKKVLSVCGLLQTGKD